MCVSSQVGSGPGKLLASTKRHKRTAETTVTLMYVVSNNEVQAVLEVLHQAYEKGAGDREPLRPRRLQFGDEEDWHEQDYHIQDQCEALVGKEEGVVVDAPGRCCQLNIPESVDGVAVEDANEELEQVSVDACLLTRHGPHSRLRESTPR